MYKILTVLSERVTEGVLAFSPKQRVWDRCTKHLKN
jgi:hypothetical protein